MKIKHTLRKVKNSDGKCIHRILTIKNHEAISKTMCKNAWLDFIVLFSRQIEKACGEKCLLDYESLQLNYGEHTEYFKQANEERRYANPEQMLIRNKVCDALGRDCSIDGETIYKVLNELYAMMEAKRIMDNKIHDSREWDHGVE